MTGSYCFNLCNQDALDNLTTAINHQRRARQSKITKKQNMILSEDYMVDHTYQKFTHQ